MIVLVVILAVLVGVLVGLCLALWFPLAHYQRWYREDHKASPALRPVMEQVQVLLVPEGEDAKPVPLFRMRAIEPDDEGDGDSLIAGVVYGPDGYEVDDE